MLRRLLLGGRHRRGRFALERCDGFIPCPMSFPDEGPRHESRLQQTAFACGSCLACQGFLPNVSFAKF
jgi:hypothetical protein